ncbi:MAG: hypothetical protein Q9181_001042 [Wetmoreana brouardii]
MSTTYQHTPRLTLTPQHRDNLTQGRGRSVDGGDAGFCLLPEAVIGSTISSINGLSAANGVNSFVFCAGSIVVLAAINTQTGINQRFFYVRPDALPIQATPTYYNPTTPTKAAGNRSYLNSPIRDESSSETVLQTSLDHSADSLVRIKATHRPKSLTSLSLSPCGKYIAVGETGHRPRILVFSTASNDPKDLPLTCLTEHTFGVRALAFSHDSRWLCSLGDVHDGGFFLWAINSKTGAFRLDSSNRCTTADTIAWMGTTKVVSVGTRHVKVWRLEHASSPAKARRGLGGISDGRNSSPVPRTFSGRNCVLGPLQDAVFTCVIGISEDTAVVCTQDGAVCLLDDTNRSQRLYEVSKKDYSITCVTLDRSFGVVWIGGKGAEPEAIPLDTLHGAKDLSTKLEISSTHKVRTDVKSEDAPNIVAICCVENRVIATDARRGMSIYDIMSFDHEAPELSAVRELPTHDSAILGVIILPRPNERHADFLTYSETGLVLYWLWDRTCASRYRVWLDQPTALGAEHPNSLQIVRFDPRHETLLAGDKAGVLHLVDTRENAEVIARAHNGEIHDLALQKVDGNDSLAASCGRDKMIQIFRISKNEVLLQQSLIHEHAGSIRSLEFADNASILASMSSDRTIVLHKKMVRTDDSIAFVSMKVMTLKASPTAMSLLPEVDPILLVSATDRCVRKINLAQGGITHTFKTSNHPHGESVVLSRFAVGCSHRESADESLLAGFSSADGSIRVLGVQTGLLLATVQGQSAVSDLAIARALEHKGDMDWMVISTGFDGTTVMWRLTASTQHTSVKHEPSDRTKDVDSSKPQPPSTLRPLRRVLSKTEIADFQRSLKAQHWDASSPVRSLSPSRVRRKPSRIAMQDAFKVPESKTGTEARSSDAFVDRGVRRNKTKRTSPPFSPRVNLQSRTKRSSLDERHLTVSTGSSHDISGTANQISQSLRDFRTQMAMSTETLDSDTTQALQTELHRMSTVLRQGTGHIGTKSEGTSNKSFDDYLAKMIDNRLALRLKSEVQTDAVEGNRDIDALPKRGSSDAVAGGARVG